MKSRTWILGLTALAMMGLCAAVLARSQGLFRLGNPGLRIAAEPIYDPDGQVVGAQQVYLPARVLNFRSEALPVTRPELDLLPKDTTFGRRRYFLEDGSWCDLSVVLMGKDRTSIHKPEYCMRGQGFVMGRKSAEAESLEIRKPHPYSIPISKIIASKKLTMPDGREEVWRAVFVYWFVADGQITASHFQRMFRTGCEMIRTGTLQRWGFVSCLAVCRPGEEGATLERMKQFLSAAVPEFQTTAGGVSQPARASFNDGSAAAMAR